MSNFHRKRVTPTHLFPRIRARTRNNGRNSTDKPGLKQRYAKYKEYLRTGKDRKNELAIEPSLEILREAWLVLGNEIMTEWVATFPLTRPFGWYIFSGHFQPRICFLHENCKCIENVFHNWHSRNMQPQFEDEKSYLIRLDLLFDGEVTDMLFSEGADEAQKLNNNNSKKGDYEEEN